MTDDIISGPLQRSDSSLSQIRDSQIRESDADTRKDFEVCHAAGVENKKEETTDRRDHCRHCEGCR